MICCLVNTLELLGTYSDMTVVERRAVKTNNKLWCGNRRDTVKFVLKRLPCTCLKKLHSVTRMKFAKMGVCNGCLKSYTRSQLRVCTGCMVAEYCSKECQRAHWSYHKGGCGNPEISSRDLPADYVVLESMKKGRTKERIASLTVRRDEAERTAAERTAAEAKTNLDTIVSQRDFYFEKLRGIEVMEEAERGSGDVERAIDKIFTVMYAEIESNVFVDDNGNVSLVYALFVKNY